MKKKKSYFYKIYFLLLGVFVICLAAFAYSLDAWLKDFNDGIPETVSRRFFEDNFENLNAENILSLCDMKPGEFETEQDLRQYVEAKLSQSELTYTSISSAGEDNLKKYIVKAGEYKIAGFSLIKDADGGWDVSSVELYLTPDYKQSFRVLDTSVLYLNGKVVSDEYVTERTLHENAAYLPADVKPPEWVTYTVTGLTKKPVAEIVDRNGANPPLRETDGIYCEEVIYDLDEKNITSVLLAAAKKYAAFMQNDAKRTEVLPYFEKGTDLYTSINYTENNYVWEHDGFDFEDVTTSEFFRYDEKTVSVRISFTHILKKYGKQDYRDITDITYFAHDVDGKYLIFASKNN